MKKIRQVIFAISALLVLQSFTVMAFGETEKQKYTVGRSEKEFEIRFYPSAILATVYSDAKSFSDLGYNPPFQPFGRRNEIIVNVKWKESDR